MLHDPDTDELYIPYVATSRPTSSAARCCGARLSRAGSGRRVSQRWYEARPDWRATPLVRTDGQTG